MFNQRAANLALAFVFLFSVSIMAGLLTYNSQQQVSFILKAQADEALDAKMKSIKAGRGKAQLCTRCHGRLGMVHAISKNKFEGTVEAFVIKELVDFKRGQRLHAVMSSISQTLSDQDITDVAAWYQAVSVKP